MFSLKRFFAYSMQPYLVDHSVAPVIEQKRYSLRHLVGLDHALGRQVGTGNGDHIGINTAGGNQMNTNFLSLDKRLLLYYTIDELEDSMISGA